ncbi:MAG: hypothetical protein ACRYFS_22310 [Janthinobacterium lividum]
MTHTKFQLTAAALCAGLSFLSLPQAQAQTPGVSLAALLARLQADETKQATDEATIPARQRLLLIRALLLLIRAPPSPVRAPPSPA